MSGQRLEVGVELLRPVGQVPAEQAAVWSVILQVPAGRPAARQRAARRGSKRAAAPPPARERDPRDVRGRGADLDARASSTEAMPWSS